MAPEQLRAAALDPRTDVFALGVIAYEMLSGDLPFSRGSLTDVILAQARGAQPLTERDPAIPAALDRAVRRALDMTPDGRPATPHAFASEVLQALGAAYLDVASRSIDLGERRVDLLLPHRVRGGAGLPCQLGLGELQRFLLPHGLRIDDRRRSARAAAVRLTFFHPLRNPRFSVDQSFSRISHPSRIQETEGGIQKMKDEDNSKRGEARRRIGSLPPGGRRVVSRLVRRRRRRRRPRAGRRSRAANPR